MPEPEVKPEPIFKESTGLGIHTSRAYDSEVPENLLPTRRSGPRPKYTYNMYSTTNTNDFITVQAPVKVKYAGTISSNGAYVGESENVHLFEVQEDLGLFKKGDKIGLVSKYQTSMLDNTNVKEASKGGEIFKTQKVINARDTKSSNYVKVFYWPKATPGQLQDVQNGTTSPRPYVDYSLGTRNEQGDPSSADTGTGSLDVGDIAKAAAFSTFFSMPSYGNVMEAQYLTGQRSLLNDQPLMPFVQQLSMACLRQFMSTPAGDFFAFYPDYFGAFGKPAYWLIEDVEIIDGSIELSDDQLATHVYVVGDIVGPPSASVGGQGVVDELDRLNTGGVVNVFNAFMADFLNGTDVAGGSDIVDSSKYPTLAKKEDAINFLKKYGARPYYEEQPAVRAPIYEAFLAYQRFCLKWSEQFKTQFQFTFMPELFPGGIVAFPKHGLQCYVASVTHNCSYESGFTTTAELMAPAAIRNNAGGAVDPDRSWVHAGMIRSWPKTAANTEFKWATDTDPAKEDKKD